MSPLHVFLVHTGFVGFSLVLLVFLAFVPFYKTIVGAILFCVHLNFWLILLLVLVNFHGGDPESDVSELLRNILYPFTTLTAYALLTVVLRAQITGRKNRPLESHLFNRVDVED